MLISSSIKLLSGETTIIEFCEALIVSCSYAIKILILDKSGHFYISSSNIGISKRFSKKSLLKYLRFTKFDEYSVKKYTLETLKDTLEDGWGWAILESIYY
jgi:hypothetical protein